ncbi:sensor histidine kinase [Streptomyces sp. NPDC004014]
MSSAEPPTPAARRAADAVSGEGTAAEHVEQVLIKAAAMFRIGGLAQIVIVLALAGSRYPSPVATLGLVGAIAAESALLILAWVRAGVLRPACIGADTGFCAVALVGGAALTAPQDGATWAHFMYPFTILTCVGIGLTYQRLLTVEMFTLVLALTYATSAILIHHDPAWNTLPNALTYFANTTVAWAVARQFRANGHSADDSRVQAVLHAHRVAQQELRERHSRALHDRALQTLETLARGSWITDPQLLAHVAAEAAWLRGFVENDGSSDGSPDLLNGLHELVRSKALIGLRIDLTATTLRSPQSDELATHVVAVLLDATNEALTNVVKHAGVSHASIRARLHPDCVEISVTDQGRGFEPAKITTGIGLRSSITARLNEIGGTAIIESAPGQGTLIRMTAPLTHSAE